MIFVDSPPPVTLTVGVSDVDVFAGLEQALPAVQPTGGLLCNIKSTEQCITACVP